MERLAGQTSRGAPTTLHFKSNVNPDYCAKSLCLTMSEVSRSFGAHYGVGSEKSAISLALKICAFQPGLAVKSLRPELGPTWPSLRSPTAIMIICSNSRFGGGMPRSIVILETMWHCPLTDRKVG